jgi:hypothetical protein
MSLLTHYTLSTRFRWGKHRGKTLDQVVAEDPHYIDWCLIHHEEFVIADAALMEVSARYPVFLLSELAEFARGLKLSGRHTFPPFNPHAWVDLVILKALRGED